MMPRSRPTRASTPTVKRVANRGGPRCDHLAAFARHPREAVVEKLEKAKVAYGRVSSLDDLKVHRRTATWRWTRPPAAKRMLAPGALHDGTVPQFGAGAALGQHTAP